MQLALEVEEFGGLGSAVTKVLRRKLMVAIKG